MTGPAAGRPDDQPIPELLRELTPGVLGALVRRFGQFDACEDALQEALLAAVQAWSAHGRPENPKGWLLTVASRRMIDEVRTDHARRRREQEHAAGAERLDEAPGGDRDRDDSLALLFLCCHPALSDASQVALTLRAVGGLSTAQIAAAFLVPEPTMAQRISRAKQAIKSSGASFEMPGPADRIERLGIVLHVLYLIFNEGYTATAGDGLTRTELSGEAIRLARWLHRLLPADSEVAGLLALMLLTDARRDARTGHDGRLIPLDEQDRSRWDRGRIAEGVTLLTAALPAGQPGPYQVQAAIAAVHDEASSVEDTDWPEILGLYDVLDQLAPGPMVSLNRAVAVAMVAGPAAGLAVLDELEADDRLAGHHRLHATRAHLLEMAGDAAAARAAFEQAAGRTASEPEREYLRNRAARLTGQERDSAGM